MPGRVNQRRTAVQRQSAPAQTPKSAAKKDSRTRSPSIDIPEEGPHTSLRKHVSHIFVDAQRPHTAHRKLAINLRKVQEACCFEDSAYKIAKDNDEYDADDFNAEVIRCILRLLVIKKGEAVGNRLVKFLRGFFSSAINKDNELVTRHPDSLDPQDMPTSRLLHAVLTTMLSFVAAKDKVVRFRAVQIIAYLINTSSSMDADLSDLVRMALLKRIHDKESSIRMHAVFGLGPFTEADGDADDSDDSDGGASGVLEKLLILLQNDPSAEVRKSVLLNLDVTPQTLPYQLERARDSDAATRRALFARLLPNLGDFRHLSLTHRDKLLRWGLRDRDEHVRKATARLFCEKWIDDCAARPANRTSTDDDGENAEEANALSTSALMELLERIDVLNSASNGVAHDAMQEFWAGRPDYRAHVEFDEDFWTALTPEGIFITRTYNDYCRGPACETNSRLLDELEGKMPEVTKFGFYLEREVKTLIATVKEAATGGPDGDGDDDMEQESISKEFVVEQMLAMALTLDYSDDFGRQKMLALIRDALTMPELPEEATRLMIQVLHLLAADGREDRDFCGLVLEAIAEVHDTIMDPESDQAKTDDADADESFHSARSEQSAGSTIKLRRTTIDADGDLSMEDDLDEEKAVREIMVNMKCLHIAQCMLQNVQCDLEANVHLVTMLNNLVVPAVRSQEAPIRERGLVCLGLCCLLAKNLAEENLTLFLHCFAKGHAELQIIALQIMTDVLTTHPSLIAPPRKSTTPDGTEASLAQTDIQNPLFAPVMKTYVKALKSEEPLVQSCGATAVSKLMLGQLITSPDLLKQLVITYLDPDTQGNAQVLQALTYFIPVYCHSRAENAARMVGIATSVIAKMSAMRESFMDDDDEEDDRAMVTLGHVGGLLVDWTDPRKMVTGLGRAKSEADSGARRPQVEQSLHLAFAEQVLERLITSQTSKDERKVLFNVLGKLHINVPGADSALITTVLELLAECEESKLPSDATSRNTLTKMQNTLLKLIHDVAGAERGAEEADETALGDATAATGAQTPRSRRAIEVRATVDEDDATSESSDPDEPTRQLELEMQATQIEDESVAGSPPTRGAGQSKRTDRQSLVRSGLGEEYDVSQLPDETEMQSLIDSLGDDEDEEL